MPEGISLAEAKQQTEELAIGLLSAPVCQQAVEAVAQALLQGVQGGPPDFRLEEDDVHRLIADVLASTA